MRGRKSDPHFLSNFISKCIKEGKLSTEDIINEAKSNVLDIDNKIKEVNSLRLIRGNLLDIITTFEKSPNKKDEEIIYLSFFKIKNTDICLMLCNELINGTIDIKNIDNKSYLMSDVKFCVKQLLEHKILHKSGDHLFHGPMFDKYINFLSIEYK